MKKTAWKKNLILMCVLLCMLFLYGCGGGENSSPGPEENGKEQLVQLYVKDGKLTDGSGKKVQLRGASTHGINWFSEYINPAAFNSVKKAGGNVMRLAMYTDEDGGYLRAPEENIKKIKQGIETAKYLDMYAIVDWHILSDGDPNAHLNEAITFFDAIASSYAGDPAVIYEICNEPNHVWWDQIKQFAYAIVPVIRQYSPEALILIGTPDYASDLSSAMEDPFPAENVMYTYHYYAGEKQGYDVLKKAVDDGFPVFVSEWGVGNGADGKLAEETGSAFARYLNSNNISWCAWSLCNKDEPYSLISPGCGKLGGFLEEDLSASGKIIFKALEN